MYENPLQSIGSFRSSVNIDFGRQVNSNVGDEDIRYKLQDFKNEQLVFTKSTNIHFWQLWLAPVTRDIQNN